MVYLVVATAVALLGLGFALRADSATLSGLNYFSNAAGILSRVIGAVDAVRRVAAWHVDGEHGPGPLALSATSAGQQSQQSQQIPTVRRAAESAPLGYPDTDPQGNPIPPRMDTSAGPDAVLGGNVNRGRTF